MSIDVGHSPVGHVVTDYEVQGHEQDIDSHWLGADMVLSVKPIGRFFLNVVTKAHFANKKLETFLIDREYPEELFTNAEDISESKPPFVLNDAEITDEVLRRKFIGRVVEADLAASLWYLGPESTS